MDQQTNRIKKSKLKNALIVCSLIISILLVLLPISIYFMPFYLLNKQSFRFEVEYLPTELFDVKAKTNYKKIACNTLKEVIVLPGFKPAKVANNLPYKDEPVCALESADKKKMIYLSKMDTIDYLEILRAISKQHGITSDKISELTNLLDEEKLAFNRLMIIHKFLNEAPFIFSPKSNMMAVGLALIYPYEMSKDGKIKMQQHKAATVLLDRQKLDGNEKHFRIYLKNNDFYTLTLRGLNAEEESQYLSTFTQQGINAKQK